MRGKQQQRQQRQQGAVSCCSSSKVAQHCVGAPAAALVCQAKLSIWQMPCIPLCPSSLLIARLALLLLLAHTQ